MSDWFSKVRRSLETRRARESRKDRQRRLKLDTPLEALEERWLLTPPSITLSLSGSVLTMTDNGTMSSLTVIYKATSKAYVFTANTGETFGVSGSLNSSISFTSGTTSATLTPTSTNTWSGLGYSFSLVPTDSAGASITLGDESNDPASNFAMPFSLSDSGSGVISGLTIDDKGNTNGTSGAPQTYTMNGQSLSIGGTPIIKYTSATFSTSSSLTVNGGSGVTTFNLSGTPSAATTDIVMHPSSSSVATITLGGSTSSTAAYALGPVVISSITPGLATIQINDAADPVVGQVYDLTSLTSSHTLTFGTSSSASFTIANMQSITTMPEMTIEGGTGGDTFSIGRTLNNGATEIETNPASGRVNSIILGTSVSGNWASQFQGDTSIVGGGAGTTTVTVNDSFNSTGRTTTLTTTSGTASLSYGPSSPTFTFTGLGDASTTPGLTLSGGSGSNTFVISGTPNSMTTAIDTGSGNNIVSLYATGASDSTLAIDGGGGSNTLKLGGVSGVGILSLAGTVNINDPGGSTSLSLDDSEDTSYGLSLTIGSSQATLSLSAVMSASLSYSNLSSLTFSGSSDGGNTVTVNGTPAGTSVSSVATSLTSNGPGDSFTIAGVNTYGPLLINAKGQGDHVNVGAGNLSGISAKVTISSLSGSSLTVNDSSDSTAMAFVVSGTSLTFADAATPSTILGTIAYSGAPSANLTVEGGTGGNSFSISNTPASMTTTIDDGTGSSNSVLVIGTASGTTLAVNSQGTSDTVNLGNGNWTSLSGTFTSSEVNPISLIVDYHLATGGKSFAITDAGGSLSTSVSGNIGTYIFADSGLGSVEYEGGSHANSFTINGTPNSITTTIDTGTSNNTVNVQGTGSLGATLDIVGGGGSNTVKLGGGSNIGILSLGGTVNISDTSGSTALTIDDSEDPSSGLTYTLGSSQATVSLSSVMSVSFNYSNLSSFSIKGSSYGDNNISVTGTPGGTSATSVATSITSEGSGDSITISGVNAYGPLFVNADSKGDDIDVGNGQLFEHLGQDHDCESFGGLPDGR